MVKKGKPAEPAGSREAAGHTQVQAAALLDVPVRTWQDWEGGTPSKTIGALWIAGNYR
jgi:DNA-binding transcriptional regulator YiaG